MNAQVLAVLLLNWLIGATIAALLIWYKARPRFVYCIFIGVGLLTGCAYNWAFGMSGSGLGWIMLAVCSLLWLQGAWLVTSVLPRWITPTRPQRVGEEKGESES
jgi:hypothetical protein